MTGFRLASSAIDNRLHAGRAERLAAGADARVVQQVGDQLLHPRDAVDDVVEELVGVGVELALVLALDQLHVAGDHPQRLLKVVRGDVGELFEFLVGSRQLIRRALQGFFGLFALGDLRPIKADALDLLDVMDRLLIPFLADHHLAHRDRRVAVSQGQRHRFPVGQPRMGEPVLLEIGKQSFGGGVDVMDPSIQIDLGDGIRVEPGERGQPFDRPPPPVCGR